MKNGDCHIQELEEEWYLQLDEEKKSQERQNCVRRFAKIDKIYPTVILDATNLFVTDINDTEHVGTNPKILLKATSGVRFADCLADAKQQKSRRD